MIRYAKPYASVEVASMKYLRAASTLFLRIVENANILRNHIPLLQITFLEHANIPKAYE